MKRWFASCCVLPVVVFFSGCANAEEEATCPAAERLRDATKSCSDVRCLVDNLRSSPEFIDEYWERKPLLLHVDPAALGDARLQWDDLVEIAERGLSWTGGSGGNSLVHPTMGRDDRFRDQPMTRQSMEDGTERSTLLMAAVQTLHEGVAKMILEFQSGLGLSVNGNVYASRQGLDVASPLHTDRMDIFIVQTSGQKRWKVHQPKDEAANPVWGPHGNAHWGKGDQQTPRGIPLGSVGKTLVDAVLKPGDVLYIPRGFPHTTSTVDPEEQKEPSVAVTVATHTEAHHYVYEKVLRCALAKSGFCEATNSASGDKYCPIGVELTKLTRSQDGKDLRRALPIGFLNQDGGWFSYAKPLADTCLQGLQKVMKIVEEKGIDHGGDLQKVNGQLPLTAGRTFDSIRADLVEMEKTFAGSSLNEQRIYGERQKLWHQVFSMVGPFQGEFCHEGGPKVFFGDYFAPELEPDDFTKQLIMAARR